MKTKQIALACIVAFLAIIGFLLWKNDVRTLNNKQEYKPGQAMDNKQFEVWRMDWEKQRQQ